MSHKYLILINSTDKETIVNRVKDIADGYWVTCNSCVCLISTDEQMETDVLRDKLKKDLSGSSICVIELLTTGNAAANGIYAIEKTWDWIKGFATEDELKIKNDAVTQYKNNIASKIIPNAEVRNTEVGIGI